MTVVAGPQRVPPAQWLAGLPSRDCLEYPYPIKMGYFPRCISYSWPRSMGSWSYGRSDARSMRNSFTCRDTSIKTLNAEDEVSSLSQFSISRASLCLDASVLSASTQAILSFSDISDIDNPAKTRYADTTPWRLGLETRVLASDYSPGIPPGSQQTQHAIICRTRHTSRA